MQKIEVNCPFCNDRIEVLHKPDVVRTIYSHTATFGTTRRTVYHKEKYEALEDCPNCGKSKKEIQKALIEGVAKPKSKEELKKQLEDLGLLGKFGGNK